MDPIIEYKKIGWLPSDPVEAKCVKARDKWFELWDETLYEKKHLIIPFLSASLDKMD